MNRSATHGRLFGIARRTRRLCRCGGVALSPLATGEQRRHPQRQTLASLLARFLGTRTAQHELHAVVAFVTGGLVERPGCAFDWKPHGPRTARASDGGQSRDREAAVPVPFGEGSQTSGCAPLRACGARSTRPGGRSVAGGRRMRRRRADDLFDRFAAFEALRGRAAGSRLGGALGARRHVVAAPRDLPGRAVRAARIPGA